MINKTYRLAMLLVGGGVVLLVGHHVFSLPGQLNSTAGIALAGGVTLAYGILGVGLYLLLAPRFASAPVTSPDVALNVPSPVAPATPIEADSPLADTVAAFKEWLADAPTDQSVWSAFDQFVREILSTHLGAARTRCFHVLAGDQKLQSLTPSKGGAEAPAAREGILGHVATSGRGFYVRDAAQGDLLKELATEGTRGWQLAWPVRREGVTVGLVAVGELRDGVADARNLREGLLELLNSFWLLVSYRAEALIARSTDKTSGVLTREDFFTIAERLLGDAQTEKEPVVVAVLAVEGLRGLDDAGLWELRTSLIERIGQTLAKRMRGDDVVGRFADDRFTLLLRRLDSGLGRIIAQKHLEAINTLLREEPEWAQRIRVRAGLAGSGFAAASLDDLLVQAFDAVDQARKQNSALIADVDAATPTEGRGT